MLIQEISDLLTVLDKTSIFTKVVLVLICIAVITYFLFRHY